MIVEKVKAIDLVFLVPFKKYERQISNLAQLNSSHEQWPRL
jgi:hypothetical protein